MPRNLERHEASPKTGPQCKSSRKQTKVGTSRTSSKRPFLRVRDCPPSRRTRTYPKAPRLRSTARMVLVGPSDVIEVPSFVQEAMARSEQEWADARGHVEDDIRRLALQSTSSTTPNFTQQLTDIWTRLDLVVNRTNEHVATNHLATLLAAANSSLSKVRSARSRLRPMRVARELRAGSIARDMRQAVFYHQVSSNARVRTVCEV